MLQIVSVNITIIVRKDQSSQKSTVTKPTISATESKEESKEEIDEFEFEVDQVVGTQSKPSISNEVFYGATSDHGGLPIPPQEWSNAYFLMNHLSVIISDKSNEINSGNYPMTSCIKVTPLSNDKEIYSNSAACPLYGSESQGYNFLITGGYYSELEEYEEGKSPYS